MAFASPMRLHNRLDSAQSTQPRSQISPTACVHCRSQKIRCSRILPACSRCVRRHLSCGYPEPPDRRLLASARQTTRDGQTSTVSRSGGDAVVVTSEKISITCEIPPLPDSPLPAIVESPLIVTTRQHKGASILKAPFTSAVDDLLPEYEVGLYLIEIYFARYFAAALIFDRQQLMEKYRAGRVPAHVLLSIFAVVSLLIQPHSGKTKRKLTFISFPDGQGTAWAEAASRLTLAESDKPSIDNIRASELLAFYWWAVGEVDRVVFYLSVSRHSLRIIKKRLYARHSPGPFDMKGVRSLFKLRQACWIKASLVDAGESYPEASFSSLSQQFGESGTWDEELLCADENSEPDIDTNDWFTWDEVTPRNCGTCCVRLFLLWREIRNLVRQTWNNRSTGYMTVVFEHDAKVEQVYRTIPVELRSKDVMGSHQPERRRRNAFLLNSIYYLCVIYLHASTVPGFSGKGVGSDISSNLAEFCARTALLNANLFAEMARAYLATRPDFSKIPSFTGYCAFIAGSVHAVMLAQGQSRANDPSWTHAVLCLLILQELKCYFPVLSVFWRDLKAQIEANSGEELSVSDVTVRTIVFDSTSDLAECAGNMLPVSNSLFQPPSTVKDSFILRCYLPVPEAADSSDVATETVAREEIGSTQAWDETAPGSTGAPYPTTEFEYNIPTDDPVAEPFGVEDSTFTSPTVSTSDRTTSLDDDNLGFLTMDPNNATNYLTSADLFGLPNIATYHGDGSEVLLQWEEP